MSALVHDQQRTLRKALDCHLEDTPTHFFQRAFKGLTHTWLSLQDNSSCLLYVVTHETKTVRIRYVEEHGFQAAHIGNALATSALCAVPPRTSCISLQIGGTGFPGGNSMSWFAKIAEGVCSSFSFWFHILSVASLGINYFLKAWAASSARKVHGYITP